MAQISVAAYFPSKKRVAGNELKSQRCKALKISANNGCAPSSKNSAGTVPPPVGIEQPAVKSLSKFRPDEHFVARDVKNPAEVNPHQLAENCFLQNAGECPSKQMSVCKSFAEYSTSKIASESDDDPVKMLEITKKGSSSWELDILRPKIIRFEELQSERMALENVNEMLARGKTLSLPNAEAQQLQQFHSIELDVIASPHKKLTATKKSLLSPSLKYISSKVATLNKADKETAAHYRFQTLVDSCQADLHLPTAYKRLMELFKCVDSVCAMLFNRKEIITFKKLKAAVQRISCKNFELTHLGKIKTIYPDAFDFSQNKLRNYGSVSKQDYYQLVITPIVTVDDTAPIRNWKNDDAKTTYMTSQMIVLRQKRMHNNLINKVKDDHDKFLRSLNPPLIVCKESVIRWHPDFDLEKCADVEIAPLPMPPNLEKYSSAKDILSTARNLFNCKTTLQSYKNDTFFLDAQDVESSSTASAHFTNNNKNAEHSNILKTIPISLIERIKSRQASRGLECITGKPTQEEPTHLCQLPRLASHLRNIFITEKKNILPMDLVLKKIRNSYLIDMKLQDIKTCLMSMSKKCSDWVQLIEIRQKIFVKIDRNSDIKHVTNALEKESESQGMKMFSEGILSSL